MQSSNCTAQIRAQTLPELILCRTSVRRLPVFDQPPGRDGDDAAVAVAVPVVQAVDKTPEQLEAHMLA